MYTGSDAGPMTAGSCEGRACCSLTLRRRQRHIPDPLALTPLTGNLSPLFLSYPSPRTSLGLIGPWGSHMSPLKARQEIKICGGGGGGQILLNFRTLKNNSNFAGKCLFRTGTEKGLNFITVRLTHLKQKGEET